MTVDHEPPGIHSPSSVWRSARQFPETYPGDCPAGHYLLLGDEVLELAESGGDAGYALDGDRGPLDVFLARRGLSPLPARYPVLAYGANRNPATLRVKLAGYRYRGPAGGDCIPVLKGRLADADVVACGLHGQGYFYGELLLNSPFSAGTDLDVWVGFLDEDQLRVLHDSEGIRDGMYSAAGIPGVRVDGMSGPLTPLGYVTNLPAWSSAGFHSPLGFSQVGARNRRIPAMTSSEIMAHVLDQCGLRSAVCAATALVDDSTLPHELAKYLNGQWWYQFHTGDTPIAGFRTVLSLFREAMDRDLLGVRSRDHLDSLGLVLDVETAYRPGPGHTLAGMTA